MLCLGAAIICAGDQTPIAPFFLKMFPHLVLVRFPVKGLIFVLLPAIFVSAVGLVWMLDKSRSASKLYFFLALWIIVALLGPTFYYSGIFGAAISFLCTYCKTTILTSEYQIAQHDLFISFLVTGAWGSAFSLIACLYRSGYLGKTVAYGGLLTLAMAPMVFYGMTLNKEAAPGGYYEKPAALDLFLQKWTAEHKESADEQFRITHIVTSRLFMPTAYFKATNDPYFLAVLRFGRDVLLPDMHYMTRWNYSNGYTRLKPHRSLIFSGELFTKAIFALKTCQSETATDYPLARFCGLSNSKYVITEEEPRRELLRFLTRCSFHWSMLTIS